MRLQASSLAVQALLASIVGLSLSNADAAPAPAITISPTVPNELNPPFLGATGGAPTATLAQAAAFAWQEFIALNWPAGKLASVVSRRDTPSLLCRFGDPQCLGPTVWETFRSKVEIFPGTGNPPGYPGVAGGSFGYNAPPQYNYSVDVPACDPAQATEPVPWVNLDETDQIGLDNMYAGSVQTGVSPGNSSPQLVRFLAKANRQEYVYVAGNSSPTVQADQWWYKVPTDVIAATKAYLAASQASPPAGSTTMVSLPYGTIEMKAGWRPLNPTEMASGRFHTATVRFYEAQPNASGSYCYRNATWGLVALHIIQKTPSAPYFIYTTFEQADNLKTAGGQPVEDVNGSVVTNTQAPAQTPQECLVDPQPPAAPPNPAASTSGSVILTTNTATCKPVPVAQYCSVPGNRLYFRNEAGTQPVPAGGNICVNRRAYAIPNYAINANDQAHDAITTYLERHNISSTPWLYYKLVDVQYYPYDKAITVPTPNGNLYTSKPPFTAQNPPVSSYYLANSVVETNRSLSQFSGGLSPSSVSIATDWRVDGGKFKDVAYAGHGYDMGGCMGCHGAAGQNRVGSAGDFSVILGKGHVRTPEIPALVTPTGLTAIEHNQVP